ILNIINDNVTAKSIRVTCAFVRRFVANIASAAIFVELQEPRRPSDSFDKFVLEKLESDSCLFEYSDIRQFCEVRRNTTAITILAAVIRPKNG
ncbi:unnamed protein product, partial [Rotaria sp. Silwood1]